MKSLLPRVREHLRPCRSTCHARHLLQCAALVLLWLLGQAAYTFKLQVAQPARDRTLVVYVYSDSDPAYRENLDYFLRVGVAADDPAVHYVIVIQAGDSIQATGLPPALLLAQSSSNVQILIHKNECYDIGTLGWFFASGTVELSSYKYFIFLNASVRGPFLPAYWPAGVHWTAALTGKLTAKVKLVGSTINCGGIELEGMRRQNPHVQSMLWATDRDGLAAIRRDPKVFQCFDTKWEAILHGELGISAAVLAAGYNLDSLMLRYQGVDWRDKANWNCNAGINPFVDNMYDGVSIHPLEQMFVKVKGDWLQREVSFAAAAATYSRWKLTKGQNYSTNGFHIKASDSWRVDALLGGSSCFDFAFYADHNPDLPLGWGASALWQHFARSGQFEPRPFRFRCPVKPEQRLPAEAESYGEALHAALGLDSWPAATRASRLTGAGPQAQLGSESLDWASALQRLQPQASAVAEAGGATWDGGRVWASRGRAAEELQAPGNGSWDARALAVLDAAEAAAAGAGGRREELAAKEAEADGPLAFG